MNEIFKFDNVEELASRFMMLQAELSDKRDEITNLEKKLQKAVEALIVLHTDSAYGNPHMAVDVNKYTREILKSLSEEKTND